MVASVPPYSGIFAGNRAVGRIALTIKADGDGSHRHKVHEHGALRVRFPNGASRATLDAVMVNTAGGMTGGDSFDIDIAVGDGAGLSVTTAAAEKIYRSLAGDAAVTLALEVGAGAWLEWLPQETILFDGARLERRSAAEVAPGGRLLAGEMLVFGRRARGERFSRGRLHDAWRVRRAGRLVWADAFRLEGDVGRLIEHPAGCDGAAALATLFYAADDAASWLEAARDFLQNCACRAAATVVNGVLLARLIGREAGAVREGLAHLAASLRAAIAGLPARLPRVWAT